MRIYTVHENTRASDEDARVVLVREGFSWLALALPLAWILFHRVWLGLALYAAACLGFVGFLWVLGFEIETLQTVSAVLVMGPVWLVGAVDPVIGAASFAFALLVGFEANDAWRLWLRFAGYQTEGVIMAPNLIEAERRFFETRVVAVNPTSVGPSSLGQATGTVWPAGAGQHADEPVLGLFPERDRRL